VLGSVNLESLLNCPDVIFQLSLPIEETPSQQNIQSKVTYELPRVRQGGPTLDYSPAVVAGLLPLPLFLITWLIRSLELIGSQLPSARLSIFSKGNAQLGTQTTLPSNRTALFPDDTLPGAIVATLSASEQTTV
jgi:hypothetical protein